MNPEPLKDKGIKEMKKVLPDYKSYAEAAHGDGRKIERKH